MSELDRRGESAAVALLNEVTGAETEEALAMVRAGGSDKNLDRPRWALLALAAAALVVLVGGVALLKSRDTDEVEPPLATPPSSSPVTNPGTTDTTQVPATVPTTAPATAPGSTSPAATTAPATEPPTTEAPTTTAPVIGPAPTAISPLADQPDFGGASLVAYAGDHDVFVTGSLTDGTPVLWHWSDTVGATGAWSHQVLPGDNPYVPVAFVDSVHGYAFVDGYLQRTSDAGLDWNRMDLTSPSGGGVSVISLAVGAGYVHALAVDQDGAMTFRLYTMPVDGDTFTASSVEFPPPAGGEPVASFAFDDSSGWMAVTSRTLMGAAKFSGGQWTAAPDITCVNGGITFASSGDHGDLVRSCDSGYMGSDGSIPVGTQMEASLNGGQTFSPVGLPAGSADAPPFFTLLARPGPTSIVIAGQGDAGPLITLNNGNNGQGWHSLGLPEGSFVSDLEAHDGNIWVAVGSTSSGDQKVWVSRDGGSNWAG